MGHAGTLDPLAQGVLPVALGEATKVTSFLLGSEKVYQFRVAWGRSTTTDDEEGETLEESLLRPSLEQIEAILPQFRGPILQAPPIYSAKKIDGVPAYKRARRGDLTEMAPVMVDIRDLVLLSHEGETTLFQATVSKGTYVRSLARDMGQALGCYGHTIMIDRRQVGPFSAQEATPLEDLTLDSLEKALRPLDCVLQSIPHVTVTEQQAQALRFGQAIPCSQNQPLTEGSVVYVTTPHPLGLCVLKEDGLLYPTRLFNLKENKP